MSGSTNLNKEQSSSFDPDASNVPGNPQLNRDLCKELREPAAKQKHKLSNVFSSLEMKTNRLKGVAGNCSEVICVTVQGVNCSETLKSNWKRPGWTTQVTDYKYVEKVFTNLRHKLNRSENDEMSDFKTNVIIWGLFESTTMK